MDAHQNLKQQLPYPYNRDLSDVLRHLDRRTPASRARLANDPVTAAYLAAAMRLIERRLGPAADRVPVDPDDTNSVERPLFKFLSQREVVAEMANNPDPFLRQGSVSTMRSTWRSQSDFVADVLNFALWPPHYPSESSLAAAVREQLIDGPDFAEALHHLAFYDITTMIESPSFRLALAAVASAEGDDTVKGALTESWRRSREPFKQLYSSIMAARGLRLREGISLDEFAGMVAALASGLRLRAIGGQRESVLDNDQRRSLLGKATLALILGCVERASEPPGMTVEAAVNSLAGSDG